MFDYYFVENKKTDEKNDKKLRETLKSCSQILSTLFNQFNFDSVLQSIIYLIQFLNKLDYKGQSKAKMVDYEHLNIKIDEYSTLERKYLIYNVCHLINELLTSTTAISIDKQFLFENLIENLLIGIINLSKQQQQVANEDDLKFLKAISNKYYDCMENLILNLNINLFINIIRKLIKHDNMQIKRRILILLNNKLRKQEQYVDENDESIKLLTLIDDLIEEIKLDPQQQQQQKLSNEIEINNQTILFTIKLLTKRIGDKNTIAFMKVLKYLCENLLNKSLYLISNEKIINQNFLASVLLLCGELCRCLKSSCLIYLNQIVTFIFNIIDLDDILSNDLLVLSSITCLFKISQNLSNFLSPYLKRLVYVACTLQYKKMLQDQLLSSNVASKNSFSNQNNNISISSDIGMEIDAFLNQTAAGGANAQVQQSKSMQQIEFKLTQLRNCLSTNVPLRLLGSYPTIYLF